MEQIKKRCSWCNPNNPLYIQYHDEEWGKTNLEEGHLFEMLLLESFQAGLSWECILNKRENFRQASSNFNPYIISQYSQKEVIRLCNEQGIIRNRLKILTAISNAKIFLQIEKERGSFKEYLLSFTKGKIFYEYGKTTNALADSLSKDLRKRGMKFVGPTVIYSYLQAVGIIHSHEKGCYLYEGERK